MQQEGEYQPAEASQVIKMTGKQREPSPLRTLAPSHPNELAGRPESKIHLLKECLAM